MDNDKDFQLLESILLENGQYFILDKHLKRLQSSASFFNFYYNEEEVRKKLLSLSTSLAKGGYKVRLLLSAQGEIIVESEEIEKTTGIKKVRLAEEPIDQKNIFHYYKTTKREIYNKHRHNLNNEIYDV